MGFGDDLIEGDLRERLVHDLERGRGRPDPPRRPGRPGGRRLRVAPGRRVVVGDRVYRAGEVIDLAPDDPRLTPVGAVPPDAPQARGGRFRFLSEVESWIAHGWVIPQT